MEQESLWETIAVAYQNLAEDEEEETHIWMDLSLETTQSQPADYLFELPSPWMLYGIDREQRKSVIS